MTLRVLFVFDVVAHYHAEMFQGLEQRLARRGIELHLASGEVPKGATGRVGLTRAVVQHECKYRPIEVDWRGWTLRRAPQVRQIVEQLQPAVVVCMAHSGNLAHWALVRGKAQGGYRLLAWQSGFEYHMGRIKSFLLKRFVPHFDHHLAYHSNARDYALGHGARPAQVTVMHNTVNEARIELLPPAQARQCVLERHPEIGQRRIVLFVGAVLIEKKVEQVLDALTQLARADVVLLVVGDGDHLPALKAAAAGRRDVVFAGSVVQGVGPYFDAADVFVMPGTGGLGLNEAMAHGLPMLAGYADGSADDLVVDGETGYRLREGTTLELAQRMSQLLDDEPLRQRLGRTGAERIRDRFSFQRFLDRIEAALVAEVEAAPVKRAIGASDDMSRAVVPRR
jgi:glycosyltransferase involved in cell wall biosynthesis